MHKVIVTAVARQDWPGYWIPGNSVEITPDPMWPANKARILGAGLDEVTGKPRATFLEGGKPVEIEVDDMLLAHLKKDELVRVELVDQKPPAANAAKQPGSPPSSKAK
jgi:hypothetical protein